MITQDTFCEVGIKVLNWCVGIRYCLEKCVQYLKNNNIPKNKSQIMCEQEKPLLLCVCASLLQINSLSF